MRMIWTIALIWLNLWSVGLSQQPFFVDLNPDNGRSDVRSPHAFNWPISTVKESERLISGVQIRLTAVGPTSPQLTFGWWKAGYDTGATLSSDGVTTVASGDAIHLSLAGLNPGQHSLASWHNALDGENQTREILIDVLKSKEAFERTLDAVLNVRSTYRVRHDDDAATSYITFTVAKDEVVLIRYRPASARERVVLNGFALDVPDPSQQACKHWPSHDDEHVLPDPTLKWQSPRAGQQHKLGNSVKYHIYFGTDRERVALAKHDDAEYMGETADNQFAVSANSCLLDYFWRVDCETSHGSLTPGTARRFKIRQLAFPGAEGYGRFAIGGRGGRVLEVTNLNDSGPGSLRDSIDAEGPRTIVFRVGGTIKLNSKLLIRNPYITIAGHTAPGDGICVRGYTFGCFGTHDVIMRYIRLRVGDESGETMDGTGFASTDHSIFDHCSISWSIDEAVSSRSAKNITLQRCIVAEALNVAKHKKYKPGTGHSFAGSISGDIGSFHHNLLAHCAGRNWSLAGGLDGGGKFAGRLDIRNNVVFHWQHRTNDGGVKALNLVNNLYLPGPTSRVFHLLKPDVGSVTDRQQYFVKGNRMEGHFDESGDNWRDAVVVAADQLIDIRLAEPFCDPYVTTHTVDELLDNVLLDVGANHTGLDAVDQRVIENVRQRTFTFKGSQTGLPGIIDSQADAGGWPELKSGLPKNDRDHDGLPDDWEIAHRLNPDHPDQNNCLPSQSITVLEAYLAELVQMYSKPSRIE